MTKTELKFNQEQNTGSNEEQLVFPKLKETEVYLSKDLSEYTGKDFYQFNCADTSEIGRWFEDFTTNSIGLWIDSIVKTECDTKSITNEKGGENRLRVVLKLKPNPKPKTNLSAIKTHCQAEEELFVSNSSQF